MTLNIGEHVSPFHPVQRVVTILLVRETNGYITKPINGSIAQVVLRVQFHFIWSCIDRAFDDVVLIIINPAYSTCVHQWLIGLTQSCVPW